MLSIPQAVAVGVLLTSVLYLFSSAKDVTVRALLPLGEGRFSEEEPPPRLPSNAVTMLNVYGSLFFAGARTLSEALPSPQGATRPVVVLRLRGRTRVGATLVEVLDNYADDLSEVGGRLYLSGVIDEVAKQLRDAGKLDLERSVHIVPAGPILGASTAQADTLAREWLGNADRRTAET